MSSHLIILAVSFLCIPMLIGLLLRSVWPIVSSIVGFAVAAILVLFAYPVWAFVFERQYAYLRLPAFYLGGVYYHSRIWLPLLSGIVAGIGTALICAGKIRRQNQKMRS
jgi:hypothetical protein